MGTEYSLYNRKNKTCIHLGKMFHEGRCFQQDSAKIVKFLFENVPGDEPTTLELHHGMANSPEENNPEEWKEVGGWFEEEDWRLPSYKPLKSNHYVYQEISPIEGVSMKTVGGYNYMQDGTLEQWKMVDGVKIIISSSS